LRKKAGGEQIVSDYLQEKINMVIQRKPTPTEVSFVKVGFHVDELPSA